MLKVFSSYLNSFASDINSRKDRNFNIVVTFFATPFKTNLFIFLRYLYLHPMKNWDFKIMQTSISPGNNVVNLKWQYKATPVGSHFVKWQ